MSLGADRPMLGEQEAQILGRLSVRARAGGSLAKIDELDVADCVEALEALLGPVGELEERLSLWLGEDYWVAERRARQLRAVLEASGTLAVCGDIAQANPVMTALQELAYLLGTLVRARAAQRPGEPDASQGLLATLRRRLAEARQDSGVGLLLLHCAAIDRVDATHGVRAGDSFVRAILGALRQQVLRPADAAEAISRDEFACVLCPAPSEGVALLAAQKVMRVLQTAVDFGDFASAAEPRIGIALHPEHGNDAETLLQRAKAALRVARSGHEPIAVYRADAVGSQFDESRYAARLRHAIQHNELQLHYQPQVSFHDGRIIGAEALLRWTDAQLGAVPPNIVVNVAETTGLTNDLAFWVIGAASRQCAEFRKLHPEFNVSVNISPSNLQEEDLAAHVGRSLRTWGLPGDALMCEITETAILNDYKTALQALDQLKRLGVGVSIDDFGTGYSSMYYLAQMPLDELKIDIMFVRQMLELPSHAKIVRSLIELAHNLELGVVAEGVENDAVWSALRHLGCDRAQGWYVGKPMSAQDLAAQIRRGILVQSATQ